MIDRFYLIAAIVLLWLYLRILAMPLAMALILVALILAIPLFVFEGVASLIFGGLQRDMIDFRYKPKRSTSRLIRRLGLDQPQPEAVLAEKAKALARAAHAVTLRHPNPIHGPIRLEALKSALATALPAANNRFPNEVQKAWIDPAPGLGTLGGLILHVRHKLGRTLFPRAGFEVDRLAAGVMFAAAHSLPPSRDEIWKTGRFDSVVLFEIRKSFAASAGFHPVTVNSAHLPLRAQRVLHHAASMLHGSWLQGLIARLANPSRHKLFTMLARNVPKWRAYKAGLAVAAAKTQAEYAQQDRYSAPGSLSEAEVTELVAKQARDSILLSRLWPPGMPTTTNSWLGGLPCLPPDMTWPRNSDTNLPLHFLAQVDCADLPTLNGASPLPREGLLLFFSNLDEERLTEKDAVVYVPKSRQSVPPRALPGDLPEIDHSNGKPSDRSDGSRAYPKWPVTPTPVKIWGGPDHTNPKTFNRDYQTQARAAHDAGLAALMPPAAESRRLAEMFPRTMRKDAEGKPIRDDAQQALHDHSYDRAAIPAGFPWCGAGIEAFVESLRQQALQAGRKASFAASSIQSKWNDTDEKRQRAAAGARREEAHAWAMTELAVQARTALGTRPALSPVDPATIERLHAWLATLPLQTTGILHAPLKAVFESILALTRQSVTDPGLLALLPAAAFALHADWLTPSPKQSQHLMLGPAQIKTNGTGEAGIRLLCLDSDYGPGMMFCDCGVIEYWIDPADLAALRFDRVRVHTAGG